MRTPSAIESAFLANPAGRAAKCRVFIKDAGGTLRDLTTYPGFNAVLGAEWGEDIDSNGMTCTVKLQTALNRRSLSPLVDASPLNVGFVEGGTVAPLVYAGRELTVEWALVGPGVSASPWQLGFHGFIDKVSVAGDSMTLECRGLEARLMAPYAVFRKEKIFSYAQGSGANARGIRQFDVSATFAVDELVCPSTDQVNGHWYKVTSITTGVTAAVEPTWPTGAGSTVTSGGVTFTEQGAASASAGTPVETVMQALIDEVLGSGVTTVHVPSSPGWSVTWWLQQRQAVWDALRMLADQIAWELRFRFDAGAGDFQLKFLAVDRAKTTADYTFEPHEALKNEALDIDVSGVRNVVQVVYSDSADLDSFGDPLRKTVTATDAGSIAVFGELWFELAESSSSNIDSASEATAMAEAIRDDLATPSSEWGVDLLFFPWTECGDLYQFQPGTSLAGVRVFDTAQKLAVVGYRHRVDETGSGTTITVRGKPSGGYLRWLGREATTVRKQDLHLLAIAITGTAVGMVAGNSVGGTTLTMQQAGPIAKTLPRVGREFHVDTVSGFTPSASTLMAQGGSQVAIPNLIPGKQYYAKSIAIGHNAERKVVALPSVETAFIAGRAQTGHLLADAYWGSLPLNGSFEHHGGGDTDPPDHWVVASGSVGAVASSAMWIWGQPTPYALSGDSFLGMNLSGSASGAAEISTELFLISPNHAYEFVVGALAIAGTTQVMLFEVSFYDYLRNYISTPVSRSFTPNDISTGSWTRIGAGIVVVPPSTGLFAEITLKKSTPSDNFGMAFDGVEARDLGETATAFSFATGWSDVGAGWQTAKYRRNEAGAVVLCGLVKFTGTPLTATITTLPVGYRPSATLQFPVRGGDGTFSYVTINSSGVVTFGGLLAAAILSVTLDGISFELF